MGVPSAISNCHRRPLMAPTPSVERNVVAHVTTKKSPLRKSTGRLSSGVSLQP